VARISNIPNWYFERVVFAGQRLVFETLPGSMIEIHTGMMASAILSDTIPCERLSISDVLEEEFEEAEALYEAVNEDQMSEQESSRKPALV
jgi:hypothetical protein